MLHFRRWLDSHDCYVFTINGFPFGRFHGARVKERVYLPDWTSPERLEYTNRLFDLLANCCPRAWPEASAPCPVRSRNSSPRRNSSPPSAANFMRASSILPSSAARAGRDLHLGLEPEPLCLLETARETVDFFDRLRDEHPGDARLEEFLGVNYDTCHLAVEFEDAAEALALLQSHRVKISKIHLSNALKLRIANCELRIDRLAEFADDTYLHQVIIRNAAGELIRYRDLDDFLNPQSAIRNPQWEEARIHFHLPLHTPPAALVRHHLRSSAGRARCLASRPRICVRISRWKLIPGRCCRRNCKAAAWWTNWRRNMNGPCANCGGAAWPERRIIVNLLRPPSKFRTLLILGRVSNAAHRLVQLPGRLVAWGRRACLALRSACPWR